MLLENKNPGFEDCRPVRNARREWIARLAGPALEMAQDAVDDSDR
jgi:hypothetical protein